MPVCTGIIQDYELVIFLMREYLPQRHGDTDDDIERYIKLCASVSLWHFFIMDVFAGVNNLTTIHK